MEQIEKKHSGIGIASFITSVITGVLMFLLIAGAAVLGAATPGGLSSSQPVTVLVGILIIALLFISLVSLGLGIGGLFQKSRKKLFAILGTIFSISICLGTFGLIIIGSLKR